VDRIIARIQGKAEGPLVIYVGGLHGNESNGVRALENIFSPFIYAENEIHGTAVALRGNLAALKQNKRFLNHDLNRIWTSEMLASNSDSSEVQEMIALMALIDKEIAEHSGAVFLIDLHTTSAPTIPFIVSQFDPKFQSFLDSSDVPYISGLNGYLDGTLLAWICDKGHCGLAFEAGQQQSHNSLIKHEAFVQLSMFHTGLYPNMPQEEIGRLKKLLDDELQPKHKHYRLVERYAIDEEEDFKMELGYSNFQKILKGQLLAQNQNGEILAPRDGNIFMPLYQKEGNDGFFIIEAV